MERNKTDNFLTIWMKQRNKLWIFSWMTSYEPNGSTHSKNLSKSTIFLLYLHRECHTRIRLGILRMQHVLINGFLARSSFACFCKWFKKKVSFITFSGVTATMKIIMKDKPPIKQQSILWIVDPISKLHFQPPDLNVRTGCTKYYLGGKKISTHKKVNICLWKIWLKVNLVFSLNGSETCKPTHYYLVATSYWNYH